MTKHMSKEITKAYLLKIPVTLHKRLIALAIEKRRSLSDQIIYMLEEKLKTPSSQ